MEWGNRLSFPFENIFTPKFHVTGQITGSELITGYQPDLVGSAPVID